MRPAHKLREWLNPLHGFGALIALIALIAPGVAAAADLPSRLEPPPPLPLMEKVETQFAPAGFYIGALGGIGAALNDSRYEGKSVFCLYQFCDDPPQNSGFKTRSGIVTGTVEAGFDVNIESSIFAGIVVDATFQNHRSVNNSNYDGSFVDQQVWAAIQPLNLPIANATQPYNSAISTSITSNWFVTARARLGFSPVEDLNLYVTGGPAYVSMMAKTSVSATSPGYYSAALYGASNTPVLGLALGAGVEYAFAKRWLFALEYMHINARKSYNVSQTFCNCVGQFVPGFRNRATLSADLVRAGIRFRF